MLRFLFIFALAAQCATAAEGDITDSQTAGLPDNDGTPTATPTATKTRAQIAYLAENRFEMQNFFLFNLLGHLERKDRDLVFELVNYNSEEEIQACLADGTCLATLDYSGWTSRRVSRALAVTESIALPVLDDPVLNCTLPQYGFALMSAVYSAAFWVCGVLGYFIIFIIFITRAEKFQKPIRADIRTSELKLNNTDSVDLFAEPEEDVVYGAIRKGNQIMTCGYDRNNPLQAIIMNIVIYLALLVLLTSIAAIVALQVSRDVSV